MLNQQSLIHINISALKEGLTLLSLLDSKQYVQGFKPAFQSNIGTHFRHVLEHYQCFFSQLEQAEFRYDRRQRVGRLEVDIEYARETISELITTLECFDSDLFKRDYTISEEYSDDSLHNNLIGAVSTTLERELMFLQSHTVHHYAMIAAMTRALGITPDEEFGVAIPTRIFTKKLDQARISNAKKVNF